MKTPRGAWGLMVLCTLFTASAQILWKKGVALFFPNIPTTLFNHFFFLGAIAYLGALVFLLLAFQRGELSTLYPILATSYVWISLLSPLFFPSDSMNGWKWAGVLLIVGSVSLLGRSAPGGKDHGQ